MQNSFLSQYNFAEKKFPFNDLLLSGSKECVLETSKGNRVTGTFQPCLKIANGSLEIHVKCQKTRFYIYSVLASNSTGSIKPSGSIKSKVKFRVHNWHNSCELKLFSKKLYQCQNRKRKSFAPNFVKL